MVDEIKPKEDKNPKDAISNQLKDAFVKEWQAKLKERTHKTLQARKIANNEMEALRETFDLYEREKAELNKALKELF